MTIVEGGSFMGFGEKLRKYRTEKGLTQAELAKLVGLGMNTINNYESGRTYPQNREVYKALAKILEVDTDHLHNENDEFIEQARSKYGYRGKKQAMQLVEEIGGLFAGGEMSDDDIDGVMRAMQDLYWKVKEENKKKYTPNKYKEQSPITDN